MANWTNLLSSINSVIKQNDNQEITGAALQNALNNIISSIGENATFVDIATPATNPGVHEGPVFYLTSDAGTYSNFGNAVVQPGEIACLKWNGNAWEKKTVLLVQTKLNRYSEGEKQTLMQSPEESDGYKSSVILHPEQAAMVHFYNSLSEGLGIFATDDIIAFYTNVKQGKTPLIIKRDGSDSGTITLRDKDGSTVTLDLAQFIKDKQNKLKHYYEGEASARMYYKKDTETGGNISIAHVLNDKQAGIYYAERDADNNVTHEDNIYLTETYGNDDGHIGISSVDNENGVTVRSSRITLKPTLITIQNNSGFLQFANDIAEMRSNKSDDGLDSIMRLTKEQACLAHFLPETVIYQGEERQSGLGIVIDDNKIAFYANLGNYTQPLTITKDRVINVDAQNITLKATFLNLRNVANINEAVFNGLQSKGDINIKAKTVISSSIDSGELKVLHSGSPYGFILRTVDNPNDRQGLMLVELLSTDGYSSYKYTFPAHSGEVVLKAELDALKARVAALEAKH